jgi:hypothetical protein
MADTPLADEQPMMTVYPSVASLGFGRALGWLYESVPLRLGSVKLSHLLFVLPASPIALALYFGLKAAGPRYVLTNRRLRLVKGPASKPAGDVPLDEIGRVEIVTSFGQKFYKSGHLVVRDHHGTERLRLYGVVRPEMFRRTILDARDALTRTDAAHRTIDARHISGAGAA